MVTETSRIAESSRVITLADPKADVVFHTRSQDPDKTNNSGIFAYPLSDQNDSRVKERFLNFVCWKPAQSLLMGLLYLIPASDDDDRDLVIALTAYLVGQVVVVCLVFIGSVRAFAVWYVVILTVASLVTGIAFVCYVSTEDVGELWMARYSILSLAEILVTGLIYGAVHLLKTYRKTSRIQEARVD